MLETQLKQKIYKVLDKEFPEHFRRKFSGQMSAGCLDLIITYKGKTVWVELKVEKNNLTPLQKKEMINIWRAGGVAYCIHSEKDSFNLDTYCIDGEYKTYSNLTTLLKDILINEPKKEVI